MPGNCLQTYTRQLTTLLRFDRSRRLRGDVVDDPVDTFHLVDDALRELVIP
jgi:hypothetical protein